MIHAFDDEPHARSTQRLARTFALCLPALALAQPATAQATIETLDACFFPTPEDAPPLDPDCGYVVVAENPDRTDSPLIKLGFLADPTPRLTWAASPTCRAAASCCPTER